MGQSEEMYTGGECAVWEHMCPDAVDGTLKAAEHAAFERHVAGCVRCAEEFDNAQRGAAWLGMLKAQAPEPPADLLTKILASTTGAPASQAAFLPVYAPEPVSEIWTRPRITQTAPGFFARMRTRTVEVFRIENAQSSFHPRMAMTSAMAFFSIALSLNLMGVRLTDLHSLSMKPSSLQRSIADTSASLTRNFQNNRVVYQVESRVSDLRSDDSPARGFRSADDRSPKQGAPKQNAPQQDAPKQGTPHGSSNLVLPVLPRTHGSTTL